MPAGVGRVKGEEQDETERGGSRREESREAKRGGIGREGRG